MAAEKAWLEVVNLQNRDLREKGSSEMAQGRQKVAAVVETDIRRWENGLSKIKLGN